MMATISRQYVLSILPDKRCVSCQMAAKDVGSGMLPLQLANRYQVPQEMVSIALQQRRLLNCIGWRRR